jgi:hypothetical protein
MSDIRTLKLQLLADTAQFSTGLNKASTDTQSFTGKVDKIVATTAKAFLGLATAVGTAAFAIGVSAVKAAIEDSKAQATLAQTLRNTTKATDEQVASVEDYITKTERASAVNAELLRPSLDRLVRSTGDITKAQKLQTLALDIAAGTGKDLTAVTEALGKAYDGNLGALKRIGVPLDDNIIKTKDFDAATKALSETFAGQADIAANTFAGRMERIKLAVDEATDEIGFALLPFLEKLAAFVTDTLLDALQGLVDGLTGKDSLREATIKAGGNVNLLNDDLDATYNSSFELGKAFRDLAESISKLLAIDVSNSESSLIKLIDSLTKIIEKTEQAIAAYERFKNSFVGGAIIDISTAPIRTVGALAQGDVRGAISVNNYFGATNDKAQANRVVKSINDAAKTGTVNKFVKPMIPGR